MSEDRKNSNQRKSDGDISGLDIDFIRVLEDLIEALIANGTIRLTDLPTRAVEKLQKRKSVRQRIKGALDLIDDQDSIL